ncbi:MAG: hypothetical protein ACI4NE_04220 [Succinivibrio sp.]
MPKSVNLNSVNVSVPSANIEADNIPDQAVENARSITEHHEADALNTSLNPIDEILNAKGAGDNLITEELTQDAVTASNHLKKNVSTKFSDAMKKGASVDIKELINSYTTFPEALKNDSSKSVKALTKNDCAYMDLAVITAFTNAVSNASSDPKHEVISGEILSLMLEISKATGEQEVKSLVTQVESLLGKVQSNVKGAAEDLKEQFRDIIRDKVFCIGVLNGVKDAVEVSKTTSINNFKGFGVRQVISDANAKFLKKAVSDLKSAKSEVELDKILVEAKNSEVLTPTQADRIISACKYRSEELKNEELELISSQCGAKEDDKKLLSDFVKLDTSGVLKELSSQNSRDLLLLLKGTSRKGHEYRDVVIHSLNHLFSMAAQGDNGSKKTADLIKLLEKYSETQSTDSAIRNRLEAIKLLSDIAGTIKKSVNNQGAVNSFEMFLKMDSAKLTDFVVNLKSTGKPVVLKDQYNRFLKATVMTYAAQSGNGINGYTAEISSMAYSSKAVSDGKLSTCQNLDNNTAKKILTDLKYREFELFASKSQAVRAELLLGAANKTFNHQSTINSFFAASPKKDYFATRKTYENAKNVFLANVNKDPSYIAKDRYDSVNHYLPAVMKGQSTDDSVVKSAGTAAKALKVLGALADDDGLKNIYLNQMATKGNFSFGLKEAVELLSPFVPDEIKTQAEKLNSALADAKKLQSALLTMIEEGTIENASDDFINAVKSILPKEENKETTATDSNKQNEAKVSEVPLEQKIEDAQKKAIEACNKFQEMVKSGVISLKGPAADTIKKSPLGFKALDNLHGETGATQIELVHKLLARDASDLGNKDLAALGLDRSAFEITRDNQKSKREALIQALSSTLKQQQGKLSWSAVLLLMSVAKASFVKIPQQGTPDAVRNFIKDLFANDPDGALAKTGLIPEVFDMSMDMLCSVCATNNLSDEQLMKSLSVLTGGTQIHLDTLTEHGKGPKLSDFINKDSASESRRRIIDVITGRDSNTSLMGEDLTDVSRKIITVKIPHGAQHGTSTYDAKDRTEIALKKLFGTFSGLSAYKSLPDSVRAVFDSETSPLYGRNFRIRTAALNHAGKVLMSVDDALSGVKNQTAYAAFRAMVEAEAKMNLLDAGANVSKESLEKEKQRIYELYGVNHDIAIVLSRNEDIDSMVKNWSFEITSKDIADKYAYLQGKFLQFKEGVALKKAGVYDAVSAKLFATGDGLEVINSLAPGSAIGLFRSSKGEMSFKVCPGADIDLALKSGMSLAVCRDGSGSYHIKVGGEVSTEVKAKLSAKAASAEASAGVGGGIATDYKFKSAEDAAMLLGEILYGASTMQSISKATDAQSYYSLEAHVGLVFKAGIADSLSLNDRIKCDVSMDTNVGIRYHSENSYQKDTSVVSLDAKLVLSGNFTLNDADQEKEAANKENSTLFHEGVRFLADEANALTTDKSLENNTVVKAIKKAKSGITQSFGTDMTIQYGLERNPDGEIVGAVSRYIVHNPTEDSVKTMCLARNLNNYDTVRVMELFKQAKEKAGKDTMKDFTVEFRCCDLDVEALKNKDSSDPVSVISLGTEKLSYKMSEARAYFTNTVTSKTRSLNLSAVKITWEQSSQTSRTYSLNVNG